MTEPAHPSFASLAEQLNRGATRAALGLLSFRSDPLREHLREVFQSAPGTGDSFLTDPVFEASFGWCLTENTLGDLSGRLLHPDVVKALDTPPKAFAEEYTFSVQQQPYQHQLEAWKALIEARPARSVLVTSGTGSGKTECFLIPILHDLATELDTRPGGLIGVQALFLYPLNALIKSQRDRLTAWTEPFGGRIRYCLYNGETPREGKSTWASEVFDRKNLWATPPPILVTNATMLEYMLVRTEDQPILAQSQGKLRWIVLDEAHNYLGSQAAELTLLLRRVLHAFGCRPEEVHFVATSATIAASRDNTEEQLRAFLADIAGVSSERVSVIYGQRQGPPLPEAVPHSQPSPPDLATLRSLSPQERFEALEADPHVRQLRSALIEQAHPLSALARMAWRDGSDKARQATLQLLDLCAQAVNDKNEPLLPLRGHFFHRALNGLWACANAACAGRRQTALDVPGWAFGKTFLERRQHCDACGSSVYELVQCGECSAEYLAAVEVSEKDGDWLQPRQYEQDEDEFQQELEPLEEDEAEGEASEIAAPNRGWPRLLVSPASVHAKPVGLHADGGLDWSQHEGVRVNLLVSDSHDILDCPCCNARGRQEKLFRPVRLGAPFLLQTAIPILLHNLPPYPKNASSLPFDGRRLLSFTDSRQGTARFAAKIQLETERNFVRSLLYHSVADRVRPAEQQELYTLRYDIVQLEQAIKESTSHKALLEKVLTEKRAKLQALSAPVLGRLTWQEAQDKLLTNDSFKQHLDNLRRKGVLPRLKNDRSIC
jgi:hypothetical protein